MSSAIGATGLNGYKVFWRRQLYACDITPHLKLGGQGLLDCLDF